MTGRTPSQTIGPFFALLLPWRDGHLVVPESTAGSVWLRGRVLDGRGEPVPDAMVETWQAAADGRLDRRDFRGVGRCLVDRKGRYAILTQKPGRVPGPDGAPQAPHMDMSVFARGLLKRVVTRVYFPDEEATNAIDPVLGSIVDPAARATLVAARTDDGYAFDVRLQGDDETVFFDV